jgi:hypothetical protein
LFRLIFPAGLAILGIATSIQAWPVIKGARDVINLWLDKQNKLFENDPSMEDYRVERPVAPSGQGRSVDIIHEWSLLFAKWSPWIFIIGWIVFGGLALIFYFKQ